MRRDVELEATIVEKYAAVEAFLDERGRRIWAATESRAIGYGGDAVVSDATGLSRPTVRKGRRELESGGAERGRIRRAGAGRPGIKRSQPGIEQALEELVDPLTRGDPRSPLRWTCKSRAKLAAALSKAGWKVSTTTVGRLLHELGYRLQSVRKSREGASHPDRNAQFEHINSKADEFLQRAQPVVSVDTNSSFGIQNDGKSLHHLYHSNSSRMVNTSNWRLRAKKTFTLSSNAVMRVSAQHPKAFPSSSSVSEIIARNRCHSRPAKLNAFNRSCILKFRDSE